MTLPKRKVTPPPADSSPRLFSKRSSLPDLKIPEPIYDHLEAIPRRLSRSAIVPRRGSDLPRIPQENEPPVIPVEMPPSFVDKVQKVSRQMFGLVLSFRGNSSAPAYRNAGYPKPPSVKGKLSNIPGAEGFLVVDDARYGKRDKNGKIITYPSHALPEDKKGECVLPKIPARRSIEYFMDGLNSDPPRFKLVGSSSEEKEIVAEIKRTGILRVSPITSFSDVNEMVFRIDLNAKDVTPPLAGVKREAMTSVEAIAYAKPEWFIGDDSEWEKALQQNYILRAQDKFDLTQEDPEKDVLMIYGMKGPKDQVVPIIGDQDLLWITIPKAVYDQLPDKKLATDPIDTREVTVLADGGKVPTGLIKMKEALLQIDKDLHAGESTLFQDPTDIPAVVASWGVLTPYEAYIAIQINKEFGIEFSHLLALIQHGPENRSPYKPEDLNGNLNHIGTDFVEQTNSEEELIAFVLRENFLKKHIITIHPGWDMEKWGEVVKMQQTLGHPVSSETLAALDKYEKNFISVFIIQESSTFIDKPMRSMLTEENKAILKDYATKNGWKLDEEKNLLTKGDDIISLRSTGMHSKNGTPEVLKVMAETFKAMQIDKLDVRGKFNELEEPRAVSSTQKRM